MMNVQSEMDTWSFRMSTPLMATPPVTASSSKPMVIPSKGKQHRREKNKPRYAPAVAALLATTTIPQPRKSTRRPQQQGGYYGPPTPPNVAPFDCAVPIDVEDDGLFADSHQPLSRISSRAALEVLLSPPEDEEEGFGSTSLTRSESCGRLSVRSSSTESVPSLDTDNESILSSNSWSPPGSRRRSSGDLRTRIVTSPPEDCALNHPLLFTPPVEETALEIETCLVAEDKQKGVTRRLNLVSNLTASFKLLKTAARSFSSLTTTIQQPDDFLTRSILSNTPKYPDERRPPLLYPSPALRRYLNPWTPAQNEPPCTGAVQMQTYNLSSRSKSARPGRTDKLEDESCACGPMVRQREVRENADFLRVIVLEMNMRREGKLSDTAQGRARYMLPPRQACKLRTIGDPNRWKAWTCN